MEKFNLEKELREIGSSKMLELPDELRACQDAVYASLLEMPIPRRSKVRNKRGYLRKFSIVTAIAASVIFIGGISCAMISPVMASTLKNMPIVGGVFKFAEDLGLKFAEDNGLTDEVNLSQTHEGITLNIPQVIYDGVRLSVAVQREKDNYSKGIFDFEIVGKGKDMKIIRPKGAINKFHALINGEPTPKNDYKLSLTGKPTHDPDIALIQLTEFSQDSKKLLPDQFNLTIIVEIEGAETPFTFEIPVKKRTEKLTYSLAEIKQYEGYKLSVKEVELTPITTIMKLNLLLEHLNEKDRLKGNNLLYELWDDKGSRIQDISGGIGIMGEQGIIKQELLFDRFEEIPQEIILKPFLPEYVDESKKTGLYKVDANGEIVKNYIKELEIRIPIQSEEVQELYNSMTQHK